MCTPLTTFVKARLGIGVAAYVSRIHKVFVIRRLSYHANTNELITLRTINSAIAGAACANGQAAVKSPESNVLPNDLPQPVPKVKCHFYQSITFVIINYFLHLNHYLALLYYFI